MKKIRRLTQKQVVAEKLYNILTLGQEFKYYYQPLNYFTTFFTRRGRREIPITHNTVWIPEWLDGVSPTPYDHLPSKEEFHKHLPHLVDDANAFLAAEMDFRRAGLALESARKKLFQGVCNEIPNLKQVGMEYQIFTPEEQAELELQNAQALLEEKRQKK